jgi:hypothetical protein
VQSGRKRQDLITKTLALIRANERNSINAAELERFRACNRVELYHLASRGRHALARIPGRSVLAKLKFLASG